MIFPDERLVLEIEAAAVVMAKGVGEILSGCFGSQLSIEYKDKQQRDPVTSADKTTQEYLVRQIKERFPDHGIMGEEDREETTDDGPAPDLLWVLDPLDGTTNFLNGLPVYASSIGVLYRGWPLVGALFIPWPSPAGGFVLHCRRGGGCYADGEPVAVYQSEEPVGNRLIGLPGSFPQTMRFRGKFKGGLGEMRTTGSIAYELAMTACGVLQYAIIGAPRMWDMLAGALAVQEANGTVMTRLAGEKRWHTMESLAPKWEEKPPTLKELRHWVAPMVAGNRQVAPLIAYNLRRRFRLSTKLRRLWATVRKPLQNKPGTQQSGSPNAAGGGAR